MKTSALYRSFLAICLVAVALVFVSCHKEGLGGNGSITGTVYHHTVAIPDCDVYIKFNATEFPGESPGVYDASVKADKNGLYLFSKVYKGDYYLYGVGFDKNIGQIVRGGVAVKAKRNGSTSQDVPVTED